MKRQAPNTIHNTSHRHLYMNLLEQFFLLFPRQRFEEFNFRILLISTTQHLLQQEMIILLKDILGACELFLIVRYCYRSFKQLYTDPLHVLTVANVFVLVDTDQNSLLSLFIFKLRFQKCIKRLLCILVDISTVCYTFIMYTC